VSAKVGVVLPEWLFTWFLSKETSPEDAEEMVKAKEILNSHNLPTVGYPGIKGHWNN
jgi:hypothetical protein